MAVSDNQIRESQVLLSTSEGIFPCMEGAATIAALQPLKDQGWLAPEDKVLLFNTGTGLKHRLTLT